MEPYRNGLDPYLGSAFCIGRTLFFFIFDFCYFFSNYIDVSLPLQCCVEDSKLILWVSCIYSILYSSSVCGSQSLGPVSPSIFCKRQHSDIPKYYANFQKVDPGQCFRSSFILEFNFFMNADPALQIYCVFRSR
jgi:hypothetical protein